MIFFNKVKALVLNYKFDPLKNFFAFLFVLFGYAIGIWMLFASNILMNILGVLLTAEVLIISA